MNLEQIRNKVLIQHNYTPNSTTYFGYVNNIINEAYVELFTACPYSFNQKIMNYQIIPDTTPSSLQTEFQNIYNTTASLDLSLGLTQNQDEIYISSSSPFFPTDLFQPFIGNQINIGGFDYNIVSAYNYTTGSGIARAVISPTFQGNPTTDTGSFALKKNYYFMPKDLIEIMDMGVRDDRTGRDNLQGKLISIPRRMDNIYSLSYQSTAQTPTIYVNDEESDQLPSPTIPLTLATQSAGASVALPAGTYKIAYTYIQKRGGESFEGSGLMIDDCAESPMSPTASVVITNATSSILATLPDFIPVGMNLQYYLAIENTGIDNRIFYIPFGSGLKREANPINPPGFIQSTDPSDTAGTYQESFTNITLPRPPYSQRFSNTNGRTKRIRLYPRPQGGGTLYPQLYSTQGSYSTRGTQKYIQLRYIYKPKFLEFDTDVPEFPEEFHYLLVDRVLVDLYNREGKTSQAEIHQRKYDERIMYLRKRYATEKDTLAVRRSGWNKSGYDPYYIFPNPSIYNPGNGGNGN